MRLEKVQILNFLANHVLCTISTVNVDTLQPEAALIAFAELPNLEILFVTLEGSRKYQNMLANNKVALVVGWDRRPEKWATLQYEGFASLVLAQEIGRYKKVFLSKKNTPCSYEFLNKKGMKLFKITPTWIGYSQYNIGNPQVIELKSSDLASK